MSDRTEPITEPEEDPYLYWDARKAARETAALEDLGPWLNGWKLAALAVSVLMWVGIVAAVLVLI